MAERVAAMMHDKADHKVVLKAVLAAGFLLTGEPDSVPFRSLLLEGLIKLASSKTEDVQVRTNPTPTSHPHQFHPAFNTSNTRQR